MRGRLPWIIGAGAALVVAAALVVLFLVIPSGSTTAPEAVLERLNEEADPGSATVLSNHGWGEGRLLLAAYRTGEQRRLAIAFAIERSGGWRLAAYTEETVEKRDVVVGSLLVASSEGGDGQPPWSAAAGELVDQRVARVEVRWASGEESSGIRRNNAYFVIQRGTTTPLEARFLDGEGTEIAKVPIEGSG